MKKAIGGFCIGALIGGLIIFLVLVLPTYKKELKPTTHLIDLIKADAPMDEIEKMVQRMGLIVIHERDHNLRTPLWHAIAKNNVPVATYLLDAGADIIDHDYMNKNQFMVAAETGVDVLDLLYQKNESINSPDKDRNSPLHYAAKAGNMATISFLIEKGANVLEKNNAGQTAKDVAHEQGHEKVMEYLEKKEKKANNK